MKASAKKRILVGIDYTKSSENALNYALMLAERSNAQITLLHVFEFPIVHTNSGLYVVDYKAIKASDFAKLEKVKQKALQKFPKANIDCINTTDTIKEVVKDLAGKKKIDYVVMGLQTKDAISKFIYSTTGVSLSAKIDCPVIIVPEKYTKHELVHAAITVDNKESIKRKAVQKAVDFANLHQCNAKLIHVQTEDEFLLFKDKSSKQKPTWDVTIVEAENFGKGITKYVKDNKTDLVVIFSHSHSVFYNLFNESNTKHITFSSKTPVMSIHD